jgi:beta-galactosidase/beta-glucuronidase
LNLNITQEDQNHEFVVLTFNGLDTIAKIFLNEKVIGETDNMFVRYRFDVKKNLVIVSACHFYMHIVSEIQSLLGNESTQS